MASEKIFISYDYDNDKQYKNLLVAWDKNDLFDFKFYDQSVDVSVNSTDASYIKSVIKSRISDSTHLLCLVGSRTYLSSWVEWEIKTAVDLGKKIIGVKIDNGNNSPSSLLGVNASWAKSFTFDSIKTAIRGW
ncbi:MAG: TIR domain-containing protein [Thermotogota bacterium]|nr:TIR domain-containing protein [Thermotogota bacterium]